MMRKILLFFTFLILSLSVSAQDLPVEYMDNTLIIKFKNAQEVEKYRSKSIPEASIFTTHNVGNMRSIWKDEFNERIKATSRQKNRVSDLPSLEHFKNIYSLSYSSDIDALTLAQKISKLPGVEYAEPRYIYKTSLSTNDPIKNSTINFHKFDRAWELSTSSSDVIIAIVDSGVNYDHEDLKDKQWFNEDEILGNGIDDDNNGFIDDYLGWDFWNSGYTDDDIRQDADPFASNNPHGTHVAGIATATPNNGVGLVGSGFNARYMAVKAGGAPDDPSTPNQDESRSVGYGYEGIIYAAINGADIINCSWGGGGFSSFGEEAVNMATELGSIVIGAAGNTPNDLPHYPSSYDNVLSVGALGTSGNQIADYSTFGVTVDVFATGTLRSTVGTRKSSLDEYATFQGTSMATPVVSGLAALIKSRFPTWSSKQIILQIRSSSEDIEQNNSSDLQFKLGKGKINAEKALLAPLPGVNVDSVSFVNSEGNKLNINENGFLRLFLKNYGAAVNSLTFTAESLTEGLTISEPTVSVGAIANQEEKFIEIPILINESIIGTLSAEMFVQFSDNSIDYSDFDIIGYEQLRFDVSSPNNLAISFSPTGNIGFFDASNQEGGIGFVPNHRTADFEEDNLLYEGGILLEANERLANNLRTAGGNTDRQFVPTSLYSVTEPGLVSNADGETVFNPSNQTSLQDLEITLKTYSFTDSEVENSVILNYLIHNTSATLSFSEVYLGIFNDWDIGNSQNNSTFYNSENDILFVKEDGNSSHPLVALATFGNTSSVLAIDNGFEGNENSFQFNLYDGYSIVEKKNSLKAGTNNTAVSSADASTVVASGPYLLEPKETISLGFVYTFGETEEDIIAEINAARAQNNFDISNINDSPENTFPTQTQIFQNYPNPFNPSTTISFNLQRIQDVNLSIYNLLGQRVKTIINQELPGGIHTYNVSLNEFSSGLYFAIFETEDTQELIKLTLIK